MCDMTPTLLMHLRLSHIPQMQETLASAEYDVTHMSHVTHMTLAFVEHDSFIHMCDVTHVYVWHDSFIYGTWLVHSYVWRDSGICVTGLIHTCDVTHSYVWHESFICVTWVIQFIREEWINICEIPEGGWFLPRSSLVRTYMYIYIYIYVYVYIYIYIYIYVLGETTLQIYIYTYLHACSYVRTGWRRLIGSPKLQIIFPKRATKYRSLLRKMTYKDKGS